MADFTDLIEINFHCLNLKGFGKIRLDETKGWEAKQAAGTGAAAEEEETGTGNAMAAATETTPLDHFAIGANNPAFSLIPKLPPIPSGFHESAIGSALVTSISNSFPFSAGSVVLLGKACNLLIYCQLCVCFILNDRQLITETLLLPMLISKICGTSSTL